MMRVLVLLLVVFSVGCEPGNRKTGVMSTEEAPVVTPEPPPDHEIIECWEPQCHGCKTKCGKDVQCYGPDMWLYAQVEFHDCAPGFTLAMCTNEPSQGCLADYVCDFDLFTECLDAEAAKGPCKTTNGCLAIAQRCLLETGCGLEYPPEPEPEIE